MGLTYHIHVQGVAAEDAESLLVGVPHSPGKEAYINPSLMDARHPRRGGVSCMSCDGSHPVVRYITGGTNTM